MSKSVQDSDVAILPELERALVAAAKRQASARPSRRRWGIAAVAAALLMAAAGAAAATGVFPIAEGETADGTIRIERVPVGPNRPKDSICLQLTLEGRGASYGCGVFPTAREPIGLLVADALRSGAQRVVYGLVASEIVRVEVRGGGGVNVGISTTTEPQIPGRFFALVAPNDGQIGLIGYDEAGQVVARTGTLRRPSGPPLSKAQAIEQSDLAGFAPTVKTPEVFLYKGKAIAPSESTRLGLVCLQEIKEFRCFDSTAQAEAFARGQSQRR